MKIHQIDGTFASIDKSNPLQVRLHHTSINNAKKKRKIQPNYSLLLEDVNTDKTQLRSSIIELVFTKTTLCGLEIDEWINEVKKNILIIYNVLVVPCIEDDDSDDGSDQHSHHPYQLVADKDSVITINGKQVDLEPTTDLIKKRKNNSYVYTKLSEMNEGTHNIYGIVYDYKTMRKMENKAYSLTLKIIDDTCTDPNSKTDSLLITINHTNQKNLFNCKQVGAIFRCHRFIVKNSRYGYQANVGPGFDYFFLSNDIDEPIPEEILLRKTFTDEDFERIKQLKIFSRKYFSQSFSSIETLPIVMADQKYLTTLNQAKEKASKMTVAFFVDVICKVTCIHEDETCVSLTVNDGSNLRSTVQVKCVELNDYLMKEVRSVFNGRDVWVKLRNAQCPPLSEWADESLVPLRIYNGSIVILPNYHFYVTRCIENSRNQIQIVYNKYIVTKVDFLQANITPISDIVNTDNIPYKYRTRGKIIDYFPKNIENFTKPCSAHSNQEFRFLFQFLIKDLESGCCLTCFVLDQQAEYLLQMPACNLKENPSSKRILEEKINQLTSSDHIIETCVVSYRVGKEKRFNMFGTSILQSDEYSFI